MRNYLVFSLSPFFDNYERLKSLKYSVWEANSLKSNIAARNLANVCNSRNQEAKTRRLSQVLGSMDYIINTRSVRVI